MQGENDVIEQVPTQQYLSNLYEFSAAMYDIGIDKFFIIRIGAMGSDADAYAGVYCLVGLSCKGYDR